MRKPALRTRKVQGLRWRAGLLAAVAVITTLSSLVVFGVTLQGVRTLQAERRNEITPTAQAAQSVQTSLLNEELGVRGFALSGNETLLDPYGTGRSTEEDAYTQLEAAVKDRPQIAAPLEQTRSLADQWRTAVAVPVINDVRNGDTADAQTLAGATSKFYFDQIRTSSTDLITTVRDWRTQNDTNVQSSTAVLSATLAITMAIIGGGTVVLWWGLSKLVLKPVEDLSDEVEVISNGQLRHSIKESGPKELRALGQGVERMRQKYLQALDAERRAQEAQKQQGEAVNSIKDELKAKDRLLPIATEGSLVPATGLLAGDWYDLWVRENGNVVMAVVDVSGHGTDAGMMAFLIKRLMDACIEIGLGPGAALARVNQFVGDTGEKFATVAVVEVARDQSKFLYASAGHLPLLLSDGKNIKELPATGKILGPFREEVWREEEIAVSSRSLLVAYTDGVVEARNRKTDEEFGLERVKEVLIKQGLTAAGLSGALIRKVQSFVHSTHLADDCTIVSLEIKGKKDTAPVKD